jgi:hypothetical protein
MHVSQRPNRRDWSFGLAAGASLGFLFLGIGARAGMRLIALASGQRAIFSIEGSVAITILGSVTGALVATLFLLLRNIMPTRRWTRGAIFWIVCVSLALRGISPVTTLNAAVFLPLFVIHGALLHALWCRVYLARRGAVDAAPNTR